ncbi:probable RNA-directed DNA polymerase from transposon BS [Trichonephila clavipes]|nr:probable RNA-directed DNA polymerase from transposon BS [Trichonephila clavipes]
MPKKHQSNVISIDGVNARTNEEAANMLAKQYEVTSRLNFAEEDRLQYKKYKSIIKHNKNHCAEDVFTTDFTLEELEYAIWRLIPKKSPGPDVIYGQMIVHFGEITKKYLLNMFITSWRSGKLPKIWKSSVIIPILKPGKDATSCKSYRPNSLTCILCKLMERIIHSRLIKFLTEHNFLHFYQTAYRANHSTVDQLFYLSQTIINGFQEKPHEKTVAVFIDLSSAFDQVWRQKLVDNIHSSGIKVSSTKNEKAERECGLPPLECRQNLVTVKFTNKLRCYKEDHISTRVFNEGTYTKILKRSSTLQLDEDNRIQINLEHSILNFMQEPPFPRRPPKETKITLNLLRPCSKKEDARILKQKGLETIEKISQENFAVAYTDGSSDISISKGGADILFQLPNKERKMHKINTGLIVSNFTRELLAIK